MRASRTSLPNERGFGSFLIATSGYRLILAANADIGNSVQKAQAVLAGADGPRGSWGTTMRHARLDDPRLDNVHRLNPCSLPGLRLSHQFGRTTVPAESRSGTGLRLRHVGGKLESGMRWDKTSTRQ